MKRLIHDDCIYFTCPGGVIGYDYNYINDVIDEYNNTVYKYSPFIDYLNYVLQGTMDAITVYSFSILWNEKRDAINKMHHIRKVEQYETV